MVANLNADWSDTARVCVGPPGPDFPDTGTTCTEDMDCAGFSGPICNQTSPRGPIGCATDGKDGYHNPGEAEILCPAAGEPCNSQLVHDFNDWGNLKLSFRHAPQAQDDFRLPLPERELDFETYYELLTPEWR